MRTEIKLKIKVIVICVLVAAVSLLSIPTLGQLIDKTRAPNVADAGIAKSLADQIGAGRGMSRKARAQCQKSCRLRPSASECARPGRMLNWRSGLGSFL